MNALKMLTIYLALFINVSVVAQQKYPTLYLPSPSNPPTTAFIAWHQSLLKGDYAGYKNVSFWLPDTKDDLKIQTFNILRGTTPTLVKITEQKTNPNGSVTFTAVGCKDNVRLLNMITVGNTNGIWRVAASGWGQPWNETAKLCPV